MRLVRRLEKRGYAQIVTQKNTLLIFRVSTKKSSMHATKDMSFHGADSVSQTRVRLGPSSPPCYEIYYFHILNCFVSEILFKKSKAIIHN